MFPRRNIGDLRRFGRRRTEKDHERSDDGRREEHRDQARREISRKRGASDSHEGARRWKKRAAVNPAAT